MTPYMYQPFFDGSIAIRATRDDLWKKIKGRVNSTARHFCDVQNRYLKPNLPLVKKWRT